MGDDMDADRTGVQVKVAWKLEKFDGDAKEGDLPVETIEGEGYITPEQLKELQNGLDQRRT
jgi:hypothetical protein